MLVAFHTEYATCSIKLPRNW